MRGGLLSKFRGAEIESPGTAEREPHPLARGTAEPSALSRDRPAGVFAPVHGTPCVRRVGLHVAAQGIAEKDVLYRSSMDPPHRLPPLPPRQ